MPEVTCNLHFFAPAKTMYMIKRLLLSAITILTVVFSYAQETTSQILGSVSDGKTGLGLVAFSWAERKINPGTRSGPPRDGCECRSSFGR